MTFEQELLTDSLDIHNKTAEGIDSFLQSLYKVEPTINDRTLLSIAGNVLHGYFLYFSDLQKEVLLRILLSHTFRDGTDSERNELLSIFYKAASNNYQASIFKAILYGISHWNHSIQGLISNLNASRIIYDNLPIENKKELKDAIRNLSRLYEFSPAVSPSIEYTLSVLS